MLPTWLLLTVVGVSMVSSSGVFWSRVFIVEIKFLSCQAAYSWLFGRREQAFFPWDFFHLCPLLFVRVGFFSTQYELLRKQQEASGHSSPVLLLESWGSQLACLLLFPLSEYSYICLYIMSGVFNCTQLDRQVEMCLLHLVQNQIKFLLNLP